MRTILTHKMSIFVSLSVLVFQTIFFCVIRLSVLKIRRDFSRSCVLTRCQFLLNWISWNLFGPRKSVGFHNISKEQQHTLSPVSACFILACKHIHGRSVDIFVRLFTVFFGELSVNFPFSSQHDLELLCKYKCGLHRLVNKFSFMRVKKKNSRCLGREWRKYTFDALNKNHNKQFELCWRFFFSCEIDSKFVIIRGVRSWFLISTQRFGFFFNSLSFVYCHSRQNRIVFRVSLAIEVWVHVFISSAMQLSSLNPV